MAVEPKLKPFPASPVKMGHEFFRSLRDRIETIAPIPTVGSGGKGVGAEPKPIIRVEYISNEGCKITFDASVASVTVCSAGQPAVLKVFTPNE